MTEAPSRPPRPGPPDAAPGRHILVTALATMLLTVAVAVGATDHVDRARRPALRATPGSWVAHQASLVGSLGNALVLLTLLVLAGVLTPTGPTARWRPLGRPIAATAAARLGCEGLKLGLHGARPPVPDWLGCASGFAFPSGHATSVAT